MPLAEPGLQARTHRMRVLIESHSGPSRNLEPPLTDQQINVLLKALSGFEVVGSDAELERSRQMSWRIRRQIHWDRW